MDYRQEPYNKIPFYMTYPMQNLYLTEMEYEKDMERMKELYPREVKKILLCIDERCDELEFEGSRIFDENPDRMMMEREVTRIYQKLREDGLNFPEDGMNIPENNMPENGMPENNMPENGMPGNRMPGNGRVEPRFYATETTGSAFALFPPEGLLLPTMESPAKEKEPELAAQSRGRCDGWLCSMVGILFSDEVYRRRCRHRRCRRWW